MKCPYCSSNKVKVLDTREGGDYETTRRRRQCMNCEKRFTTYEKIKLLDITIEKSDGKKEQFDKSKIKKGISKSCEKRGIPEEKIEEIVNKIEQKVRLKESTEIKSKEIGKMVLNKLKKIDKVAYLRYLSVYKKFDSYSKFEREVKRLKTQRKPKKNKKILQIRKRDGSIALFDQQQITNAIFKAAKAVGGSDYKLSEQLSCEVIEFLENQFDSPTIITVKEIMDATEKVLMDAGHANTAKAFILQRQHKTKLKRISSTLLNVKNTMREYLDKGSWRVKENASFQYSFSGLMLHTAGKIIANYSLNEIYPREAARAHEKGYIHIHDLNNAVVGYCAGWSLKNLLLWGFGGVPNKADSKPAKHLDVAVAHIVNFIGCLQMEFAGAQAFSSVDTLLAPFVKADNLNYKEVKQCMQRLIFHLNIPNRWAGQFPFSNLTFDWVVPNDMKSDKAIIGGKGQDFTYGECQKEMDMINHAFIDVMIEGDAKGRNFAFPIPTYNLTKDFNWDSENAKALFKMTAKYGTPYFQNYIGSGLDPKSIRAMCCRLNLDMNELRRRPGHTFGMGDNTGSIGVVTINLNRLGYEHRGNEQKFFEKLDYYMDLSKESLEAKRKIVSQNLENNFMPYTKRYLGTFENHFSTIGLIGAHEMCTNFLGKGLETKEGKEFTIKVLKHMRERLVKYQRETKNLYNLEASPAEGASYRLAKWDKRIHKDKIYTSGEEEPYLTNSSQLPVDYTADAIKAIKHQNDIQPLYTGGTIFHTFLGESIKDWKSCRALVKKIAYNSKLPYFTITPTYSICPEHGYISGEHPKCSKLKQNDQKCEKACEVMSRIVGYYRPTRQWHNGKQEEFRQRKEFCEEVTMNHKIENEKTGKEPNKERLTSFTQQ